MIPQKVDQQYAEVRKLTRDMDGEFHVSRRRALILIYAHLTRLSIKITSLQNEQHRVFLQTPLLLNALLNVLAARNRLTPTLGTMRLNSLPGVSEADIDSFAPRLREMTEVLSALEEKGDGRAGTVRKAISKWGRVEIVDAAFKVIGERVVTPSKDVSVDEAKRIVQYNDKKDEEFLLSKQDAEDLPKGRSTGWASSLIPSTCISVPLLSIERPPVADQEPSKDEISGRGEGSLAGQMAAMRGEPVKKRKDESDEESGTDDDE
ncbi:hypothetical protein H1R20_g16432, partial [Candolleomyces eurysporus]